MKKKRHRTRLFQTHPWRRRRRTRRWSMKAQQLATKMRRTTLRTMAGVRMATMMMKVVDGMTKKMSLMMWSSKL